MIQFIGTLAFELFRSGEDDIAAQKWRVKELLLDDENHYESGELVVKGYGLPTCKTIPYELKGNWVYHPKYGWQVQITHHEEKITPSKEGVVNYLAHGPLFGIGEVLAGRIYDAFGDDTIRVLNEEPKRLLEVPGIGETKLVQIVESRNESVLLRRVSELLMPYDISAHTCSKIVKRFGIVSMDIIQSDPWRLIEVPGISFPTVDKIVRALGGSLTSKDRVQAGIEYTLVGMEHMTGSLAFTPDEVRPKLRETLGHEVDDGLITWYLDRDEEIKKTAISGTERISRKNAYDSEQTLAYRLRKLASEKKAVTQDIDSVIARTEATLHVHYNEEQKAAIRASVESGLLVITGGPGVGKTTVISGIVEVNKALFHRSVALLSPTGKAAAKMTEATGIPAQTVDSKIRLCQLEDETQYQVMPVLEDLIIVDESSMLDVYKAGSLLSAIKPGKTLVFIGDVDQLSSVGAGAFLRDLIDAEICPVVRLTQIFRQKGEEANAIITNAYRINKGNSDLVKDDHFSVIRVQSSEAKIKEYVTKAYLHYAQKYGDAETICLIPTRETEPLSTTTVNKSLQGIVNPENGDKEFTLFGKVLRQGDLVMNLKNDQDKGIVNGDVGKITSLSVTPDGLRKVEVLFGTETVSFLGDDEIARLTHAWSMTVHKSQGSEYDAVVLALYPGMGPNLMKRNLIYTAVTRAKKEVMIIGSENVLNASIRTEETYRRQTNLAFFLRQSA